MKTVTCYLKISSLKEGENYKYLGIFEAEDINTKKMKENVKGFRRTRKVLKSKPNSSNLFKDINTRAVSLFRYSAAFIDWTKEEISEIDRRTRKLLIMHKTHHANDDVQRLHIKRKEGGRRLISIEEGVEDAIARTQHYAQNSQERLIFAAWRSSGEQEIKEPPKITKQKRQTKRIKVSMASSSGILKIPLT